MTANTSLRPLAFLALLVLPMILSARADLVTFDDLPDDQGINWYFDYHGLNWLEVSVFAPYAQTNLYGSTGYTYGIVSAPNIAFNPFFNDSEINSGTNYFNFYSVYFTGAWRSNLNIEVQAFTGTNYVDYGYGIEGGTDLVYDTNVIASATSPTLFTFNFLNINRLRFVSSGGQDAGFVPGGDAWPVYVMDNFSFDLVPEPSPIMLTVLAFLSLLAFHRREYRTRATKS
jgi:hypothetical protein